MRGPRATGSSGDHSVRSPLSRSWSPCGDELAGASCCYPSWLQKLKPDGRECVEVVKPAPPSSRPPAPLPGASVLVGLSGGFWGFFPVVFFSCLSGSVVFSPFGFVCVLSLFLCVSLCVSCVRVFKRRASGISPSSCAATCFHGRSGRSTILGHS